MSCVRTSAVSVKDKDVLGRKSGPKRYIKMSLFFLCRFL